MKNYHEYIVHVREQLKICVHTLDPPLDLHPYKMKTLCSNISWTYK
jgi:hypothetical protein